MEKAVASKFLGHCDSKESKLLVKVKKINRRASPRLCCWISVFSILFVILACPGLDPLEGKYEALRHAAAFQSGELASLDPCKGKRIFMYDLPPEFNVAVNDASRCNMSLIEWMDLCPRFSNDGYGAKLWSESESENEKDVSKQSAEIAHHDRNFDVFNWHDTDSYMLEKIFHIRMQKYRCLTTDPSQADAFFVPYYTGLLSLDLLYDQTDPEITFEKRKNFGQELFDWLAENGGEYWSRFGGRDHFMMKGRTGWDFEAHPIWGTGLSELPYAANMTSLMIERRPDRAHEIAIPYPTSFHPENPQTLQTWIKKVETSRRKFLFSYVGAPRDDTTSVRGIIGNACITAGESVCNLVNCSIVKCSHDPVSIYKSFLAANFCLQPKGDTSTRRSTFDCLISGAIPVFFANSSAYTQYFWHLPQDRESYSVYITEEDLRSGVSIQDILMAYSPQRIRQMRKLIVSLIPNLIYNGYENDPSSPSKDAYEISLERVLKKIAGERKALAEPTHKCWLPFKRSCLAARRVS
ncbi:unnamed protein product [Calypogeia fissa]